MANVITIEVIHTFTSHTLHIGQMHRIKIDDGSRRSIRNICQCYTGRVLVLFFELQCSGSRAKVFSRVSRVTNVARATHRRCRKFSASCVAIRQAVTMINLTFTCRPTRAIKLPQESPSLVATNSRPKVLWCDISRRIFDFEQRPFLSFSPL